MESLMDFMEPEDERVAAQFAASLPPEEQQLMQSISESFKQMPLDLQSRLRASAHRMMQEHRGNLGQLLDVSPQEGEVPVRKFAPIVIGAIFAIDAINSSMGAKRSLVGNVVTDIGNGIVEASGGESNSLGESDYGDMFEYDGGGIGETASFVDPFTGRKWGTIEDPAWYENIGMGLASGAASFVNPFALVGAGAKGVGVATGRVGAGVSRGVGRAQQGVGRGISRLGKRGTRRAGEKAVGELGDMGASFGARAAEREAAEGAVGLTDRFGRYAQGSGKSRIDLANATQAEKLSRFKQSLRPNALAGGRGWKTYRGVTGAMHSPGVRDKIDDAGNLIMGGLAAYGMSKLPDGTPDTSGGYGGQGAFGTGAAGGAAGGYGQGYGMQDTVNVTGNLGARKEIWDPHAYRHDPRAQALEGQAEFGGFGKGDNMKIGERMLKEAQDMMYKAVCPVCGKKNCTCKEYKNKKEDSKKPAHGMVIVIGSKAGPGPSKDGKREKLDSEKNEKEE
tara:strand:- start:2565 stop:4082 length:1518 start_codon:yes stop_codon:yes gene_type:complete